MTRLLRVSKLLNMLSLLQLLIYALFVYPPA